MDTTMRVSRAARTNFYIDLTALVPFLVTAFTGIIIQLYYHMHHLPDAALVLGLGRYAWVILHKASAVVSLACIVRHCAHHWSFIVTVTKKKLYRKKMSSAMVSYYLFVVFVPTALTALVSWIFLHGHARFMLVELHDKFALLLAAAFTAHLATRAGWMIRTYRALAQDDHGRSTPS